jgi:hypothetical protein
MKEVGIDIILKQFWEAFEEEKILMNTTDWKTLVVAMSRFSLDASTSSSRGGSCDSICGKLAYNKHP